MKNFKIKDLLVTIKPAKIAVFDCEQHSKPDDTTNCTECTHQTRGEGTQCTTCTHQTSGDETNCTTCTHQTTGDGTNCTNCTHQTTVTCKPHSKPDHQQRLNDSVKAAELRKLKNAIARLQENEYA
jgi:hypothetical protein